MFRAVPPREPPHVPPRASARGARGRRGGPSGVPARGVEGFVCSVSSAMGLVIDYLGCVGYGRFLEIKILNLDFYFRDVVRCLVV